MSDLDSFLMFVCTVIIATACVLICSCRSAHAQDYLYNGVILHDSGFGQDGFGTSHGWANVQGQRVNYILDGKEAPNRMILQFQHPTQPNKTFYQKAVTATPSGLYELLGE